jgi:hypothetical protein
VLRLPEFSEDLDNKRFHCGIDVHKHQITIAIVGKDDSDIARSVTDRAGKDVRQAYRGRGTRAVAAVFAAGAVEPAAIHDHVTILPSFFGSTCG